MKILIAYDGSNVADAALDDLTSAGLPKDVEAKILSVAEVWLPPPNGDPGTEISAVGDYVAQTVEHMRARGEKALHEVESFAKYAEERLSAMFPDWKVTSFATFGSPAWEIIAVADDWKPNLIVVGSHGRSGIRRLVLGSVSQRVLTEARCSVRVARGKVEVDKSPVRLIVGYDGSEGADLVIDEIARREWPEGAEVKIVVVDDPLIPTAIGRFVEPVTSWVEEENQERRDWITKLVEKSITALEGAGLETTFEIIEGNPKETLIEAAETWGADSIFVGATGFSNKVERFLIGSVSSTVANRASCSVEVVRKKQ